MKSCHSHASAHTGVGISRLETECFNNHSETLGDYHTSDIGHWFAINTLRKHHYKRKMWKDWGIATTLKRTGLAMTAIFMTTTAFFMTMTALFVPLNNNLPVRDAV